MSKYNFTLDLETSNSLKFINDRIKPNTKILEFGPANGRLTKHLTLEKNCIVDIVEIDENAGQVAEQYARHSIIGEEGDIEKYHWLEFYKNERYDYVIFADVLEHLYNPQMVLAKCTALLENNGSLLLSVPNIAHNSIILNLLNGEFKYTPLGLLDDTHIRFFTYKSLKELINNIGMQVVHEDVTFSGVGSNEISINFEIFSKYDLELINNNGFGECYQYIFEIKKKTDSCEFDANEYTLSHLLLPVEINETKFLEKLQLIAKLEKQNAEILEELDNIINSTTWKLTSPIRLALDFIKSSLKKNQYTLLFYKVLVSLRNSGIKNTIYKIKSRLNPRKY